MTKDDPLQFAAAQVSEVLECWYLVGYDYTGNPVAWSQEKSIKDSLALSKLMADQTTKRQEPVEVIDFDPDETR